MGMDSESQSDRALPALVAGIALIYNFLFAAIAEYLPDDPLYIGLSVQGYAFAGCILSLLGVIGVATNRPSLVAFFAHYLLVDTIISAVCKLLVLQCVVDAFYVHDICNAEFATPWREETLGHDTVTSPHWQTHMYRPSRHMKRCRVAVHAVQIVLVAVMVVLVTGQAMLAMSMRRYGKEVESSIEKASANPSQLVEQQTVIIEKM